MKAEEKTARDLKMDGIGEFSAFVVEKTEDKRFVHGIVPRSIDDLPDGDLLIRVRYSSLNYKDALSATGHPGSYTAVSSHPRNRRGRGSVTSGSPRFSPGDTVTCYRIRPRHGNRPRRGAVHPYSSEWAVPLPSG